WGQNDVIEDGRQNIFKMADKHDVIQNGGQKIYLKWQTRMYLKRRDENLRRRVQNDVIEDDGQILPRPYG
ncbi:hypothetical protein, partial [Breoghania sp.]|uniref:hypothetical protein n=1 Tax=Breoghania sp. TaxID=2065378 RepID=UPI00261A285E